MYRGISRADYMKNIAVQGTPQDLSSRSRAIAITAMILFALSGLISGFTVAAFYPPKFSRTSTSNLGNSQAVQKTETRTPPTTIHPVALGYPVIDSISSFEVADGTTVYTLTAHAVDQVPDRAHGKPVHAPGITCRLWLVDNKQDPVVPLDRLKSSDTLQSSPFPGEIPGLIFDASTPQTQPCNDGVGSWKYQVVTSVNPGSYYLVVLTDWKGLHYTWSWNVVTIKKQGV
jgi:hypothetical protein